MITLLIFAISLTVSAGVWLILSRDMYRIIIGLAILGTSANLVVFMSGYPGSLIPPVLPDGIQVFAADAANPLPQALVLTAIVIGFALLAYALVLGARLSQQHKHTDISEYEASEPPHSSTDKNAYKPPVLEVSE